MGSRDVHRLELQLRQPAIRLLHPGCRAAGLRHHRLHLQHQPRLSRGQCPRRPGRPPTRPQRQPTGDSAVHRGRSAGARRRGHLSCQRGGSRDGGSNPGRLARPRAPSLGSGLQRRPETGRAGRVRLPGQPAGNRQPLRLPRGNGQLGERLPRGLHDPGDPEHGAAGPQPPRLQRNRRKRQLHHRRQQLQRLDDHRPHRRLAPVLQPPPLRHHPNPARRSDHPADGLRQSPVQPGNRRRPRHRPDRLADRGRR